MPGPSACAVNREQEEKGGKPERVIMDFGGKMFPIYILRKSIRAHEQGLGRSPTGFGSGPTGPQAVAGRGHL